MMGGPRALVSLAGRPLHAPVAHSHFTPARGGRDIVSRRDRRARGLGGAARLRDLLCGGRRRDNRLRRRAGQGVARAACAATPALRRVRPRRGDADSDGPRAGRPRQRHGSLPVGRARAAARLQPLRRSARRSGDGPHAHGSDGAHAEPARSHALPAGGAALLQARRDDQRFDARHEAGARGLRPADDRRAVAVARRNAAVRSG